MSTTSNNQFLAPNQVLKYYLGKEHGLTPDQIKQADVNKDGVVNLSDVLALQKQEKAQQKTQKQQTVRDKFVEIYNNASLSNQEKAQQINQFAKEEDVDRNFISEAMNIELEPLNTFLDLDPVVVQERYFAGLDPVTRVASQLSTIVDPSSTGGAWTTKAGGRSPPGFGVEGMLREIASRLISQTGIQDLNELQERTVDGEPQTYNTRTGQPVNVNLGGWGQGPGFTWANFSFDANGKPRISTYGEDSSDLGSLLPIISIALMAVPGIGQAVGAAILPAGVSTALATAVGNAVISAGIQIASGVPVEKALTNAAVSVGVSQLVPNLTNNLYIDNAVRSVATAALTGGDVGTALANSLIATGGAELLGNASFTGNTVADSAIASAITSGVQAAATGGDVAQSIIQGAVRGASGQIAREEEQATRAASGAGFVGDTESQAVGVDEGLLNPANSLTGESKATSDAIYDALLQSFADSSGLDLSKGEQVAGLPLLLPLLASVTAHFGAILKLDELLKARGVTEGVKSPTLEVDLKTPEEQRLYNEYFKSTIGKWDASSGQFMPVSSSQITQTPSASITVTSPRVPFGFQYNEFTQSFPYVDEFGDVKYVSKQDLNTDPNLKWLEEIYFPEPIKIDTNFSLTGGDLVSDLDANLGVTAEQTGATSDSSGASLTVSPVVAAQPAPSVPVSPNIVTTPAIVLQNNNDGTALVLTQDGNATNVNATDSNTGNQLTAGDTVTVNNQDNTATTTTVITGGDGGVGGGNQGIPAVLPAQNVATGGAASARDEQNILDLINQGDGMGGGEGGGFTSVIAGGGGGGTSGVGSDVINRQNILDLINQGEGMGGGGDLSGGGVPSVITGVGGEVTGGDLASGGDVTSGVTGGDIGAVTGGDSIAGGDGGNLSLDTLPSGLLEDTLPGSLLQDTTPGGLASDTIPGADFTDLTGGSVDLGGEVTDAELIDLITSDLDADTTDTTEITDTTDATDTTDVTDTAAETPTQDVTGGTKISVLPTRVPRPRPPPGSRVTEVDAAGLLPLRPGLSEGGTDGIEGTTEEEQKPVWNVRSLKLRRALGI